MSQTSGSSALAGVKGPAFGAARKKKKSNAAEGGGARKGKRRKTGPQRSINKAVDEWLEEDGVAVGEDGFQDLDDFLV